MVVTFMKKLRRTKGEERKVMGVCGGLGKCFGIDPIYNLVKEANPAWQVSYAFVEFAHPSLEERVRELVSLGEKTIVLAPVFLTVGNHLAQGLPKRFKALEEENPGLKLVMAKHLGADPLIAQLVSKRSAEALAELKGKRP